MQILRFALIATAVAASPAAVLAHDTTPLENTRARQLQQIEEGHRTGALTRREYERLVSEQAHIAELQRRAQVNGVNGREYRALRAAQRDAAANISEDATNGRVNIWRKWKTRHGS